MVFETSPQEQGSDGEGRHRPPCPSSTSAGLFSPHPYFPEDFPPTAAVAIGGTPPHRWMARWRSLETIIVRQRMIHVRGSRMFHMDLGVTLIRLGDMLILRRVSEV